MQINHIGGEYVESQYYNLVKTGARGGRITSSDVCATLYSNQDIISQDEINILYSNQDIISQDEINNKQDVG